MTRGTCVRWLPDEGWGVLRSPELEHDVWCGFGTYDFLGQPDLEVGESVEFEWIEVEQDGFSMRATRVHRPSLPVPGPDDSFEARSHHARSVTRTALSDADLRGGRRLWEPETPHAPLGEVHAAGGTTVQIVAHADGAEVIEPDGTRIPIAGTTIADRARRIVEVVSR